MAMYRYNQYGRPFAYRSMNPGINLHRLQPAGIDAIGCNQATWLNALGQEFEKDYFVELSNFVAGERRYFPGEIYPPPEDVLDWTRYCAIDRVNVVIVGQDPYHGPGQAHGLAFSVEQPTPPPPSLRNIYKELSRDIEGFVKPKHGNLTRWAKQGVVLFNTILTVREGEANSHRNRGWETFTDEVIRCICSRNDEVVFMLWGKAAKKKAKLIDEDYHCILQCSHPSPYSAHLGFFGCHHFSEANYYLGRGREIDWRL